VVDNVDNHIVSALNRDRVPERLDRGRAPEGEAPARRVGSARAISSARAVDRATRR